MLLRDSINNNPAAVGATLVRFRVHGCTLIGRDLRQEKYLRFPKCAISSFRTTPSRSHMTLASDVSIVTKWECIATVSCLVGKMQRIHPSMYEVYDVTSTRSVARFSTIQSHARACMSPIHICRDMKPCMGTVCLVETLNGGALTRLACKRELGGRSELLTRIGLAYMSNRLVMGHCVRVLTPTEIRTRYIIFCQNVESAGQSSRFSQFLLSSVSSFELAFSASAFCLVDRCSNNPFPSVPGV